MALAHAEKKMVGKQILCYRFYEPLHNGHAMLPCDLSTVENNDVSKLSMRNASGGISFPNFFLLLFPGRKNFGGKLVHVAYNIVISWNFTLFWGLKVM